MSQTLYERITNEKNSIETNIKENGKDVNVQNVSLLLKERLISVKDSLVILCAFYEYMNERSRKEYAFIKQEPWNSYFKTNISKCFTPEKLNMYESEISKNEVLKNIIYTVCDENVKENYNKILAEKNTNEVKENSHPNINTTLVAQVPNGVYQKLKSRLNLFKNELDIETKEDLDDKPVRTTETIFDKMAKCPNELLVNIMKNLKEKKTAFELALCLKEEEYKETIKKLSSGNGFEQDKKIIALAGTHVATKPLINNGLAQKSM